jgi:hypothetical protein
MILVRNLAWVSELPCLSDARRAVDGRLDLPSDDHEAAAMAMAITDSDRIRLSSRPRQLASNESVLLGMPS